MPTPDSTFSSLTLNDVSAQTRIRLPLPIVAGNRDYKERERQLCRMHELLETSRIELDFLNRAVASAR